MADENNKNDITHGLGVEILLSEKNNFLKVKETLSRIGISKERILEQSCHILHKQGRYYIMHFTELFALDDSDKVVTDEDRAIRNTVVALLAQWELVHILAPEALTALRAPIHALKIVRFVDRANWDLRPQYAIGKHKKSDGLLIVNEG